MRNDTVCGRRASGLAELGSCALLHARLLRQRNQATGQRAGGGRAGAVRPEMGTAARVSFLPHPPDLARQLARGDVGAGALERPRVCTSRGGAAERQLRGAGAGAVAAGRPSVLFAPRTRRAPGLEQNWQRITQPCRKSRYLTPGPSTAVKDSVLWMLPTMSGMPGRPCVSHWCQSCTAVRRWCTSCCSLCVSTTCEDVNRH